VAGGQPRAAGTGLAAGAAAAGMIVGAAAPALAAQTPETATITLARGLVRSLAQAPPVARLALPIEHQILLAAVGAFLLAAAGVEAHGRARDARRRGRTTRRRARTAPTLDIAWAGGTRTVTLERAHAHPIEDTEGRLVAQVVWSRQLGWCAQASWPHSLYGPEGLPRTLAPLPDGGWLHVAAVGLRLHLPERRYQDGRRPAV
jgi:hypothetical protein